MSLPDWLRTALASARASAGMVLPNGTSMVAVKTPLGPTEAPLVITRNPGEVTLSMPGAPGVYQLKNTTPRIVPYVFIVVPAGAIALGAVPWKMLLPYFTELLKQSFNAAVRGQKGPT